MLFPTHRLFGWLVAVRFFNTGPDVKWDNPSMSSCMRKQVRDYISLNGTMGKRKFDNYIAS